MNIALSAWPGAARVSILALSAAAALNAHAATYTYEVELQATAIGAGQTVFGLATPPATPFVGSLSFVADPASGVEVWPGYFQVFTTTRQVDITIGNTSWTMAGSQYGSFWTDSTGKIMSFELTFWTEPGYLGSSLSIDKGGPTNMDWYANDPSTGDGSCTFGPVGVTQGGCISGAPGSARLTAVVPEPSKPHLFAAAFIVAIGLLKRRHRQAARRGAPHALRSP